jgi:MFS family permease
MNRTIRYIQTYLLFGFPFVATCMIWGGSVNDSFIAALIHQFLSWNLMLWFAVLTFFLVLLVVAPKTREHTLRRLANIKERDEREEFITGKAARVTYISTLSLMIFLFFCSVFSVSLVKIPENQIIDGNHYKLNFTVGYGFFGESMESNMKKSDEKNKIFDSRYYSPSTPTVIIMLICWQLIAFNLIAKKEQIKGLR